MNRRLPLTKLKIGAMVLALSLGLSAYAESPREEVAHAYRLLKKADADYNGHRVRAMHELESAGHGMGLELEGDVPEHERQWKSDERLREARRLLREARDKLEAKDKEHAAEHLEKAIKELDTALEIR